MQISPALRDALEGRLHLLASALAAAGHLPAGRGLSLDNLTLMTADDAGNSTDLSPAAQAFVGAYVPAPASAPPEYGTDLQSDDEFRDQAAAAVTNLRAFIGASSPSNAQVVAVVKLLCRVAIYFIRLRVG